ncbi:MAG: DHH family phosphoesterase [Clostridia bacterium]|nr:DHH family phosphoesterase [Clostridia bacterium]
MSEDTQDVCFACHVSPDGDSVGSAVALAMLLRARGRRAFIHLPEALPCTLAFLFETFDNTAFDPKMVVAVDVSTPERLGKGFPYADRVAAVLDHHMANSFDVEHKWVEEEAAATGLLVAALYDEVGEPISADAARALYTAVSTDTGRFCHANTTEDVLATAARLTACVPEGNFEALNRRLFIEKDAARLRLEGYVLTHAVLSDAPRCVYFLLTKKLRKKLGITPDADLGSLVDVLRTFAGYPICILAKESEKGVYKLSVRSQEPVSANAFCRVFGGGGHERAAGATVRAKNAFALKKAVFAALADLKQ